MPQVEQNPYLSPKGMALRQRDGIPPWGVHPCEVDSLPQFMAERSAFGDALRAAAELRDQIEAA